MAKKKKKGPLIYVGPGFRDTELSTYGIFADGVPTKYQGTIYEKLFVLPKELNEARREIASIGSMLHTFYQQAVKEHQQGRK